MTEQNVYNEPEAPPTPPEESSNRAFLIVAGILGAIALLVLLCIAGYVLFILPGQKARTTQNQAALNAQNTKVAMAITQTSAAESTRAKLAQAPTSTPVPPSATPTLAPTPSPTAVVALPTFTRPPTEDPRTATVAALLTQASVATRTVVRTPTALPRTGFAEDVGLPVMMGLAVLLLVVIFLARRLRAA